jgi:hypothetical protein
MKPTVTRAIIAIFLASWASVACAQTQSWTQPLRSINPSSQDLTPLAPMDPAGVVKNNLVGINPQQPSLTRIGTLACGGQEIFDTYSRGTTAAGCVLNRPTAEQYAATIAAVRSDANAQTRAPMAWSVFVPPGQETAALNGDYSSVEGGLVGGQDGMVTLIPITTSNINPAYWVQGLRLDSR